MESDENQNHEHVIDSIKSPVKRIKVTVQVDVLGFVLEDESTEQAMTRAMFEAELNGNNGQSRLHFGNVKNITLLDMEGKIVNG